jgi:hypothetical protein
MKKNRNSLKENILENPSAYIDFNIEDYELH